MKIDVVCLFSVTDLVSSSVDGKLTAKRSQQRSKSESVLESGEEGKE